MELPLLLLFSSSSQDAGCAQPPQSHCLYTLGPWTGRHELSEEQEGTLGGMPDPAHLQEAKDTRVTSLVPLLKRLFQISSMN